MHSTWDWHFLLQTPGGGFSSYWEWILSAWGWTLSVAFVSLVIALIVGFVVGTIRTLPDHPWLVGIGNLWVGFFRSIPLLVQIFLWYHVVPALVPAFQSVPSFLLVVLALGFYTSARIAEQVKAGVQSLSRGQRFAGMALGLTTPQCYRYVLLPMAVRIIFPPLTSEAMNIIKSSSVAFAVSISELTMYAMQVQEETGRGIEVYLAVTALYVISAIGVNRIMAFLEARLAVPGYSAKVRSAGAH